MTDLLLGILDDLGLAKDQIFTYVNSATGEANEVYNIALTCINSVLEIMKLVNFLVPIDTIFICCTIYLIMDVCLLHNRITQSCKTKMDIVACPKWA